MGWLVTFGIIAAAWVGGLINSKPNDRWASHVVCGALAALVALLWWNGGAAEREREAALAWAGSSEGKAAIAAMEREASEGRASAVEDCVTRGIAYFRMIEAWPTLSSGRNAAAEARERCGRTIRAFP